MMKKLLLLGIFILIVNKVWGDVIVWVNKNPVSVGDMFQLHVEAKNVEDAEEPDLSGITGLQILNRSVQNKTAIIGSSVTRTLSWTYVMIAPSSGEYIIPSLQVGNEQSTPIAIKVTAYSQNKQQKYVSLELEVNPKIVYPHQQILVRLWIKRTEIQLENETITPFELKGTEVEEISQKSFQTVKNGKKNRITEIIYAVIPEKSGKLIIPKVRYQGEIIKKRLPQNNFGNFFQNRGKRIFSESATQTVEVKPLPSGFKSWWLPSDKLLIEEVWQPDPPVFRVGEPLTRNIKIIVNGVFGSQIPELKLALPPTLKSYIDQPFIETKKTSEGLKGVRLEKWALIPSKVGKIKLPEISINWWDIKSDTLQTAIIAPKIIEILPAKFNDLEKIKEKTFEMGSNKAETAVLQNNESRIELFPWKILAFFLAFLWLATILMWFFKKNFKSVAVTKNENKKIHFRNNALREATKNTEKALHSGDPGTIQVALLEWGSAVWIEDPPRGIEQIGERIPELQNGINSLNSALYGNNQTNEGYLEKLLIDFRKISLASKIFTKSYQNSQLGPLYPE